MRLPPFLSADAGLNSGFKIPHITAAALDSSLTRVRSSVTQTRVKRVTVSYLFKADGSVRIGNLNPVFARELQREAGKISGCQWSASEFGHNTLALVAVCCSKRKTFCRLSGRCPQGRGRLTAAETSHGIESG